MNFKVNESSQKLRGGYYTPLDLAHFLTRWVQEIGPKTILEPSCGDGVFFEALAQSGGLAGTSILGFELEKSEAKKAVARAESAGLTNTTVYPEDFLRWALNRIVAREQDIDAVVGNPPFVRYQYLPKQFQAIAEHVFKVLDLKFTKHTNAWVPFILASIKLLRPGGRLAMVVPAEIIHVTHAQSLRSYMGVECRKVTIIDPEELWFEGTLQGAVIMLAEKKKYPGEAVEGLGIYPVRGRDFLKSHPEDIFNAPKALNGETVKGKWTRALLDSETRQLLNELRQSKHIQRFKDIASVDVGIVTGANKFFLVPNDVVKRFELEQWAHPMFGRSEHCPGIIYDKKQHKANQDAGKPTNFLWFTELVDKMGPSARAYIKLGESEKLHERYKCRIRTPWYTVPSVYSCEIGMLKRSHHAPRLILNSTGAFTTDTAYRVRPLKVEAKRLVTVFVNPLTALSAELEGRHYGGGVLELVPSEIERLLIPLPDSCPTTVNQLDNLVRTLGMDEVLSIQGRAVLGSIGLSGKQIELLLTAWKFLRDRRHRAPGEPSDEASLSQE